MDYLICWLFSVIWLCTRIVYFKHYPFDHVHHSCTSIGRVQHSTNMHEHECEQYNRRHYCFSCTIYPCSVETQDRVSIAKAHSQLWAHHSVHALTCHQVHQQACFRAPAHRNTQAWSWLCACIFHLIFYLISFYPIVTRWLSCTQCGLPTVVSPILYFDYVHQ